MAFVNTLPYISNPIEEFSNFKFVSWEKGIYPKFKGGTKEGEIKMPKRVDVNNDLSEIDNLPEYNEYATNFSGKHGDDIWNQLSGNGSNKKEIWGQVFNNQEKRIKGNPPVDAATSPEKLQAEWNELAGKCSDLETYDTLEAQINQNRGLDLPENWAKLEEIHKEIDDAS